MSLVGFLLIAFFSSFASSFHPEVSPHSFCYDEPYCAPRHWPDLCHTGKQQSPISIKIPRRLKQFQWANFQMNNHYLFEKAHHFYGQNNGHTAQFELTSNISNLQSNYKICGDTLYGCYNFAQFHFHWDIIDEDGSEHVVNGERYPMELHIVHYKDKYESLAEALRSSDRDAVAVVAVFFEFGDYDNRNLEPIVQAVEKLVNPSVVQEFTLPLSISSLYPKHRNFATYLGSLTTPTCDEKVIWTVFFTPIPISVEQMQKFRRVRNEEGISNFNFRPVQPLNGRKLSFYHTSEFKLIRD